MPNTTRYQPTFAERYPVAMVAAIADFLLVVSAAYLAHWWRFDDWRLSSSYPLAVTLCALVVMISLWASGLYGSWRGKSIASQLGRVYLGWLVTIGVLLSVVFFLKSAEEFSRQWFMYFVAIGSTFTVTFRVLIFIALRQLRSAGRNLKSVLLIDAGGSAALQLHSGTELDEDGFRVACTLPFASEPDWLERLVKAVDEHAVHEVWLCLPLSAGATLRSVMYALRHHTVAVRFIPEWGDLPLLNHKVSNIAGVYSLDLSCSPMDGPAAMLKRVEDIVIGGAISLMILPVCLCIALAIKLSSPGPVVFKQYRTGINGRKFKVYKFRSMVVHQENTGDVTQATRNDPRVTRIGAFLRRTSLDELPQFFNVLQGRMSIVGPRPHALAHNEYYKDLVESYMQRHKVKPGITGWAQVNGYRGETDTLDKMQKRVECDLWYIDNWSLALDIKIIFWTVFKGFVGKTAY
ncbi:undecaprenyl-phosphate glucose phosphotransferase [Pseudomonas donghuensis]|uniref:undecaprenyl-phosphate glucose phosphotransferase n=1 Tax=Pseudomonas donghuensis TaxID=1163398 RepID=UPI000C2ACE80|nr:undecaprenyl-phosphate glucose phosphotransferase [Pseudomonas donghuensis]PJY97760.1 undecaprenyl-phosphate glucose phosphotransferase [Pseudomonas donghuensis]WKY27028.1 undecaprenyl-phosphate glucose phosphotransferase [Pseudomonas donghuensis]